jgi:hypothetical protein
MTRGKSRHLLLLLQILQLLLQTRHCSHLVQFYAHKIFSNMAASNELITEWLTRQAEAATRTFQGVANEANSHEMLNFITATIGYAASLEGITRNMSGRQAAAAMIAPTAIDHADQASDDGDTVAAVVVPSATITPTDEGTTEAASAEGVPSGLKETHAEEAADAQEADANADAETDNDHQAAVLQLLKQYAIQGIELANRAQLLSAHPISTLPPRMRLNTTQRGWKTITIVYPVSGRTVIRYISPDGILFYSKRKADMYVEELAKAGGDPIAALDRFLRRYKAWQEEQKQAAKRSAGGLQEVEPKVKRTRRKEPTTTGPRIKSPPPLLTPAVAGAAVAVQPQATSGGPLLAAGLPASISQSSAESEDGLPRLSPLFDWPALEDSELDDLFAKKLSQSSRDGKVDDWDKFMESLA